MFSISQLQQFSGIKAHTIRIWEQRYNALRPSRSEGNTRHYDHKQLRRLLNIVSLMEFGYKVSELGCMPDENLFDLINQKFLNTTDTENPSDYYVTQLISAGILFDKVEFETIYSLCVGNIGIKKTYSEVLYPIMVRLGIMWTSDSIPPAQEHFITNIIRKKLFSAIDSLPQPISKESTWALFLPEMEFHEIGLLFAYYLIKKSGQKVIYLGSNVGVDTLINAKNEIQPTHLLFFMVHNNDSNDAQLYVNTIEKEFNSSQIFVSGSEKLIGSLNLTNHTKWIKTIDDFMIAISN